MEQPNQSNQQVRIDNFDGSTFFIGRRTIRNIQDDGEVASGEVKIKGEKFTVYRNGWKWIGDSY